MIDCFITAWASLKQLSRLLDEKTGVCEHYLLLTNLTPAVATQ